MQTSDTELHPTFKIKFHIKRESSPSDKQIIQGPQRVEEQPMGPPADPTNQSTQKQANISRMTSSSSDLLTFIG